MEVNDGPRCAGSKPSALLPPVRFCLLQLRKLFSTNGFTEVSTQAIVETPASPGALYHQFADKTELFAAVYEEVEAEIWSAHDR